MAIADRIDEARLREALLGGDGPWTDLQVVDQVVSTNLDLVAKARGGAPSGRVLIANFQSAGRGRLGRTWSAPPGTAVSVSVLLHPHDVAPIRWGWLPLLAGLGVVEGLRQYPGLQAWLKWPNDVLIGEGKVAGVLAERIDSPRGPAVVIGLGVNVHQTAADLPAPTATSLALQTSDPALRGRLSRTEVICSALLALGDGYLTWQQDQTDETLAASYRERCATIGRRVRVQLVGRPPMVGIATDVDSGGRLVIRTDSRVQVVGAGDVIHLRGV